VPVLTARDGPIAAIDPRGTAAAGSAEAQPAAASGDATAEPVQVVAPPPPGVALLAVRPAWVRVTAADGTVIFEKILDAGERFSLPQTEAAPTLRVGESGALYFVVDGRTYGPAGEDGVVTRNLALSPEALKAAFPLADLDADRDLQRFAQPVAELVPAPAAASE
jgi:hypothetical protein